MKSLRTPQPQTTRRRASQMKTYGLAIFATVCVLALSFALPHLTATIQDSIMTSGTSTRNVQRITLATPNSDESMVDLLRFASQGYRSTQPITPSTTDEDDAKIATVPLDIEKKASDFLQFLSNQGMIFLDPQRTTESSCTSFLATSADGDTARLLWRCDTVDVKGETYATLIIDDATGKVISFVITNSRAGNPPLTAWLDVLSEYYELNGELTKMKMFSFTDDSGNNVECKFSNMDSSAQFNSAALDFTSETDGAISAQ